MFYMLVIISSYRLLYYQAGQIVGQLVWDLDINIVGPFRLGGDAGIGRLAGSPKTTKYPQGLYIWALKTPLVHTLFFSLPQIIVCFAANIEKYKIFQLWVFLIYDAFVIYHSLRWLRNPSIQAMCRLILGPQWALTFAWFGV